MLTQEVRTLASLGAVDKKIRIGIRGFQDSDSRCEVMSDSGGRSQTYKLSTAGSANRCQKQFGRRASAGNIELRPTTIITLHSKERRSSLANHLIPSLERSKGSHLEFTEVMLALSRTLPPICGPPTTEEVSEGKVNDLTA